jgi:hypothetical protein
LPSGTNHGRKYYKEYYKVFLSKCYNLFLKFLSLVVTHVIIKTLVKPLAELIFVSPIGGDLFLKGCSYGTLKTEK